MALLDRVRERTGSDLSDTELQAMIDGITAEISARLGTAGPITVELGDLDEPCTRSKTTLRLARPLDVAQPVTIYEDEPGDSGQSLARTTLTASDYRVLHGGRTLQRLTGGPNSARLWAPLVRITYTPIGETAARDEAVIKLVQLDLSFRGGLKREKAGDYEFQLADNFADERNRIIDNLAQPRGMLMA